MKLDPRFVAIALALFAAGLGAVGALATRPAIPPAISRPVVKAIVATVRIVNPPPTTREVRAWPSPITASTGPSRYVPGSIAMTTTTGTATRRIRTSKGWTSASTTAGPAIPTTTLRAAPTSYPTTTSAPPSSSPTTLLPTTLPDLTTSTAGADVTSSTEGEQ